VLSPTAVTIRDAALRLFAAPDGNRATVREIATAAGVSPALVIRHFESREGVRDAVNTYAAETLGAILAGVGQNSDDVTGLVAHLLDELPRDSALPRYLARMAVDGGDQGRRLFAEIFAAGQRTVDAMVEHGTARPAADPVARAVMLTAHDLALLLLRDHITDALGVDPLTPAGALRYGQAVHDLHTHGLSPSRDIQE
jgi:TetR/AcrR family transcriptional regulator, regulator of cefoperazone and chloramphenicol sensitivity